MLFFPNSADPSGPLVTPAPEVPAPVAPNRDTLPAVHAQSSDLLFAHWSIGEWVGYSAVTFLVVILAIIELTRLARMLYAWRSASHLSDPSFLPTGRPARHSFSVIVPARHEGVVLRDTLESLARSDHPDFEIVVVVGDDDPRTEIEARDAATRHPGIITVVIDNKSVKTRPGALNRGLTVARGDIVGVFDAGHDVSSHLLQLIDSRFSETAADVVQAGLQRVNFQASWWSVRAVLQNYFWSRSGLHQRARSRLVALGDHSLFVRRTWLEWSGGWDEKSLAAEYELGVRLSSAGATATVAYSPEVVTRHRIPAGISSLFAERTRVVLGSLQVLEKRDWRALPSARQRRQVRYQLWSPLLNSATALLVPIAIIAAFVIAAPSVIVLVTFIPLAIALVTLSAELAGLSEFGGLYGQKVRLRDYARLILGTLPFQFVLAAASLNAVVTAQERDYSLDRGDGPARDRPAPVAESATAQVRR